MGRAEIVPAGGGDPEKVRVKVTFERLEMQDYATGLMDGNKWNPLQLVWTGEGEGAGWANANVESE